GDPVISLKFYIFQICASLSLRIHQSVGSTGDSGCCCHGEVWNSQSSVIVPSFDAANGVEREPFLLNYPRNRISCLVEVDAVLIKVGIEQSDVCLVVLK